MVCHPERGEPKEGGAKNLLTIERVVVISIVLALVVLT